MNTILTYKEKLTTFEQTSLGSWESMHRQPPDVLYHYTNSQGLIGILKDKDIWASNVCFLNDSKELIHGRNKIADVLTGALKGRSKGPVFKFLNDCLERLKAGEMEEDVYAACFCTEGDVLSQWRAYGSMGDGYSLGLCGRTLKTLHKRTGFRCRLRKVIYCPVEQSELVRQTVCNICNLLEEACDSAGEQALDQLMGGARGIVDNLLKEYLYCFKHPAFREEKEWRLVHICPAKVYNRGLQFRSAKGKIIPYLSVPLTSTDGDDDEEARVPLVGVIYGAVLAPETTQKSLCHLLKFHNYENVRTIHSDVPLVT